MQTPKLVLSVAERLTLDALAQDKSVRAQRRSAILRAWADGHTKQEIARELGTRPVQVLRVIGAFQSRRLQTFSRAALERVSPQILEQALSGTPAPITRPTAPTTMREVAYKIIRHQYEKLGEIEPNVRQAADVEAVHDMRVACRRMNSAFRLFKPYLPAKRVKKLRKVMEQLRDALGAARNLDVLLQDLVEYRAARADADTEQLASVAETWRTERAVLQDELIALLDSDPYQTWSGGMNAFLEEEQHDMALRVADELPAIVWTQYGAVRAFEKKFGTASLQELHALRIEIKRLRYTLEFFSEMFDEKPKTLIEPLVELQDQLGAIQDAVVAGTETTKFIVVEAEQAQDEGIPIADLEGIAAYNTHVQERIAELRTKLPERWEKIMHSSYRHMLAQATASL